MDVPRGEGNSGGRILQSAPPPQCEIDVGVMISLRRYSEVLEAEQARAQEFPEAQLEWINQFCGTQEGMWAAQGCVCREVQESCGEQEQWWELEEKVLYSGMLRAIPTTCQHGGLGALSKWQCQGGQRCETENKLDWNPTYSYWNLLKLE